MFGFDDILIGAGIGALGSALFGGNPIKGAALGGVTGGLLGGAPAGAWGGGQATALSTVPTTATEFEAAMGLPSSAFIESGGGLGTALGGRTATMGIAPVSEGFGTGIWDKVKPYANLQNMSGAMNMYNQFNQRAPTVTAQGGGISKGQSPQGSDVMALIKSIQQPERKHISLL